jgi:hypothetical protein
MDSPHSNEARQVVFIQFSVLFTGREISIDSFVLKPDKCQKIRTGSKPAEVDAAEEVEVRNRIETDPPNPSVRWSQQ